MRLRQNCVVHRIDSAELPLICWSLLYLIISSLFSTCNAENVIDVTLVETNNGQVRINNDIEFTCSIRFKQEIGTAEAVNLEYGDQNTVCVSWSPPSAWSQTMFGPPLCNSDRVTVAQTHQRTMWQFKFTLKEAQLSDEERFFCKVYESFSDLTSSADVQVNVLVPPTDPVLWLSKQPSVVGESLQLTCEANAGKPHGDIVWYRTPSRPGAAEEEIIEDRPSGTVKPLGNGTVQVMKIVVIQSLDASHNGVKYRCVARNAALRPNEALPSSRTRSLDVRYKVSTVTIIPSDVAFVTSQNVPFLYLATSTNITCIGNGNPEPTVVWTKISGNSDLIRQRETLFVDPEARLGEYVYRCEANNTVSGEAKVVSEDYKFALL